MDTLRTEDATVLEALSAVTSAFARGRELQPALDRLLESTLEVVKADGGSVMLHSEQDERLRVVAARGPRAALIDGQSQPADRSVAGWVLRTRQALLLRGPATEGTADKQAISDHPHDLGSSVVIPLRVGNRALGVLNVSRQPGAPDMDDRTVSLLQLLAQQASILIDSTQLLERETATMRAAADELNRAYEHAEEARGKLRAILDATSEAIALVSADGETLSVNRRFHELFAGGLLRPGALATDVPLSTVRERAEATFADASFIQDLLADEPEQAERELTQIVVQRQPTERELELFSTPVRDQRGERLGRLLVFRDVTRERAADRMKSEFVSLVSHELRTPLTSIQGFVSLLMDGEVGPLRPPQQECLATVQSNATRLLTLVTELLDMSRVTSGLLELHPQPVALAPLVEDVVRTLQPQLAARQHRLVLEVPTHLPCVWGEPARLTQILMNLVSNAIKYTPPAGEVAIRATAEARDVVIQVSDTGIGLSPEEQAQVFTRFYRANNAATRAAGGTGLGLAITRSLVELHGGEISLTSLAGQGSTFTVRLPADPAAQLAA